MSHQSEFPPIRFVRNGRQIVFDQNNIIGSHQSLADINSISLTPRYQCDGGFCRFFFGEIQIGGKSPSTKLPINRQARESTISLLRSQYPGYSISEQETFTNLVEHNQYQSYSPNQPFPVFTHFQIR